MADLEEGAVVRREGVVVEDREAAMEERMGRKGALEQS